MGHNWKSINSGNQYHTETSPALAILQWALPPHYSYKSPEREAGNQSMRRSYATALDFIIHNLNYYFSVLWYEESWELIVFLFSGDGFMTLCYLHSISSLKPSINFGYLQLFSHFLKLASTAPLHRVLMGFLNNDILSSFGFLLKPDSEYVSASSDCSLWPSL